MAGVNFLNVLDVARSLGSTPAEATPLKVAEWLLNEYGSGGLFNYDPATNSLFDLFAGRLTPEQAIQYCSNHGNPRGRKANASAVAAVAHYASENISQCYKIGNTAVVIGRAFGTNVHMGFKTPLARVRDGRAFIVMPGFRMAFRPNEAQLDFVCSAILGTFARDDMAVADVEYLYAGPPELGSGRSFRVVHGVDRKLLRPDDVDAILDIYVKGVNLALRGGADARAPSFRGYKIYDPRDPGFI